MFWRFPADAADAADAADIRTPETKNILVIKIRHGESENNISWWKRAEPRITDDPLRLDKIRLDGQHVWSGNGKLQLEENAPAIQQAIRDATGGEKSQFDLVFTSPLVRALETFIILSDALEGGLCNEHGVYILPELKEHSLHDGNARVQLDTGNLPHATFDDLQEEIVQSYKSWGDRIHFDGVWDAGKETEYSFGEMKAALQQQLLKLWHLIPNNAVIGVVGHSNMYNKWFGSSIYDPLWSAKHRQDGKTKIGNGAFVVFPTTLTKTDHMVDLSQSDGFQVLSDPSQDFIWNIPDGAGPTDLDIDNKKTKPAEKCECNKNTHRKRMA